MAGASLPETGPEPRRSGAAASAAEHLVRAQKLCEKVRKSISSNYSSSERELIDRVFRLFETVTCLRLVPRTSEKDYVRITPTGRCSGEVGRRGGRQRISLPHWCLSFGHGAHELMHTAGFWHEHQRPDRDQFVRVLWDNIKPRHRRADYGRRLWEELGEGSWLGPYDFRSILHYSGRGSAVDSTKPTMVARQGGVKLGGNGNLTDIDIWKINTQYHCWQRPSSRQAEGPAETHGDLTNKYNIPYEN
ncbi:zinc metalloproteinase nas-7-like [Amphibalanus amphitrite]|uniref:zinc metalloproteinase nas-7-like n=1 Tax=Amphibalanus amphitrite TaxID=1232801 RepID=UPI001C9102EB|nr:zinc metalloproteinase nas-7-like [Amphibalanus amphitrite]